jgi:outer membrane protein assembly factor BamB
MPSLPPRIEDDVVYTGCRDFHLYALNADTGKLIWKFKADNIVFTIPVIVGNTLFTGSYSGNFYAIDASTGRRIWKFSTGGMICSSPASHKSMVYFGCWDCNLYALTIQGELAWKFRTSLSYQSPIDVEEPGQTKTFEVAWQPYAEAERRAGEDERDIADYGEFKGTYIDTSKTDYLGFKKKGYKSN